MCGKDTGDANFTGTVYIEAWIDRSIDGLYNTRCMAPYNIYCSPAQFHHRYY